MSKRCPKFDKKGRRNETCAEKEYAKIGYVYYFPYLPYFTTVSKNYTTFAINSFNNPIEEEED